MILNSRSSKKITWEYSNGITINLIRLVNMPNNVNQDRLGVGQHISAHTHDITYITCI